MSRVKTKSINRLIVADSEKCADLLYATGFFVPDPMIWFHLNGKSYGVLSPLEVDRAKKSPGFDRVLPLDRLTKEVKKKYGLTGQPQLGDVLVYVLKANKVRSIHVPPDFPLYLAEKLEENKIRAKVLDPFYPEREIKSAREIQNVTRGQRQAEAGLNRGIEVLSQSRIGEGKKGNFLIWKGQKLTSERLRGEIDAAVVLAGGLPSHTIVAGGIQACDPHESGFGPLKGNQTIILDIFPRDQKTGYYGDLTRTVVKGKASDKIKRMYQTVFDGQQMALEQMKEGIDGKKLHEDIVRYFKKSGYPTEKKKGRWVGFFHGTGHSLGLEIHEPPRFGATVFRSGQVMTVEPGLYYPGIGGVRLEDLVVVQKNGIKNLTQVPKILEIR